MLCSGSVTAKSLLEEGLSYGRSRHWRSFETRDVPIPLEGIRPSLSFYGHVIDLTLPEQQLWSNLKSRVRTPIRRAQEAGVNIGFEASPDSLGTFYDLLCQTRRKHGLPPQPFGFFVEIHKHLITQGKGCIALARAGDFCVAAGLFLHFGKQAIHKFGASSQGFQPTGSNQLLLWEVMRRYQSQGFDSLDLGRTSIANAGLRLYKQGFGASERLLYYVRYDFRKNQFVTDRDKVYGWFNHVFGRFPLPALRLAGRILYPHLS